MEETNKYLEATPSFNLCRLVYYDISSFLKRNPFKDFACCLKVTRLVSTGKCFVVAFQHCSGNNFTKFRKDTSSSWMVNNPISQKETRNHRALRAQYQQAPIWRRAAILENPDR